MNKKSTESYPEIWALVLAAGRSERMGVQKLLLPLGENTMIGSVVDHIVSAGIDHILLVLGSHREEVERAVCEKPVITCFNPDYAEGMHTSVICGFRQLPVDTLAVVVFLGDQPFIPAEVIKMLITNWELTGKMIIIPTYRGYRGHPTLFDCRLKEEVLQMDPHIGLRSVIDRFPQEISEVETHFSVIIRDIDTKNDYLNELNQIGE